MAGGSRVHHDRAPHVLDDVFARMEAAGGVQLDADQREQIQSLICCIFSWWVDHEAIDYADDRKRMSRLVSSLDAEALRGVDGFNVFQAVCGGEIERLRSIREYWACALRERQRPGRKVNPSLRLLLEDLWELFGEAGGEATGVSHDDDGTRTSPFISFAWACLVALPDDMRPPSGQALAVAWQRMLANPRPIQPTE